MTLLEAMTLRGIPCDINDQFTRVSAVRFITSAPFGYSIEDGLLAMLDENLNPKLTTKEYFYCHDAPLEVGQVVVVPARDTITLAIVSNTGLESTHFAGKCSAARNTMKNVLAVLLWSPTLYNLARERRDTESKKAQLAELAELKQQYKRAQAEYRRAQAEYNDLKVRTLEAHNKVSDLNNKIRAAERKEGF